MTYLDSKYYIYHKFNCFLTNKNAQYYIYHMFNCLSLMKMINIEWVEESENLFSRMIPVSFAQNNQTC